MGEESYLVLTYACCQITSPGVLPKYRGATSESEASNVLRHTRSRSRRGRGPLSRNVAQMRDKPERRLYEAATYCSSCTTCTRRRPWRLPARAKCVRSWVLCWRSRSRKEPATRTTYDGTRSRLLLKASSLELCTTTRPCKTRASPANGCWFARLVLQHQSWQRGGMVEWREWYSVACLLYTVSDWKVKRRKRRRTMNKC